MSDAYPPHTQWGTLSVDTVPGKARARDLALHTPQN